MIPGHRHRLRIGNTVDNRYFDHAERRGLKFADLTPDELVAQRLPYVQATRERHREFWAENVRPGSEA